MTNTKNDFMPEGYDVPSSAANYMKFQDGENKFRIMSKPIIGWLDWQDKKPLRFRFNNKPSAPVDPAKPIKHFWAMVVWNYNEEKIQVIEITQKSIQAAIQEYSKSDDWGSPLEYDLKVSRKGKDLLTEYTVMAIPHKKLSKEIEAAYEAKKPINLDALFEGGDPFESSGKVAEGFPWEEENK